MTCEVCGHFWPGTGPVCSLCADAGDRFARDWVRDLLSRFHDSGFRSVSIPTIVATVAMNHDSFTWWPWS